MDANNQPMADSSDRSTLSEDHERLREALYPLINHQLDDVDWRCEDIRLFFSAKYFALRFPSVEERHQYIAEKQAEADHADLIRDHEELRRLLFPDVEPVFALAPEFRESYYYYKLYSSLDYFAQRYPSPAARKQFLQFRRQAAKREALRKQAADQVILRAWIELERRARIDQTQF